MEEVGNGSFGLICRAKHRETKRIVAIKRILDIDDNPLVYKALIREVHILRKLSSFSQNTFTSKILDVIAPVSFVDCEEPYLFLVMEYFENDLHKIIDDAKEINLNQKTVLRLIYNVICSAHFLHSAGVMHRDLKPSNILVASDLTVRICDFGMSRSVLNQRDLKNAEKKPKRRLSAQICTRWYRAPELILLQNYYNEKVDIWSIGCILSELLYSSVEYESINQMKGARILFKGDSCYPMSPMKKKDAKTGSAISKNDQLQQILRVLGDLDEKDLEFVKEPEVISHCKSLQVGICKIDFKSEFTKTSSKVCGLLQQMLEFNPKHRPTLKELLALPLFDKVRDPAQEVECPEEIRVGIDRMRDFDYSKRSYKRFTLPDLKKILSLEIDKFKIQVMEKQLK